MSKTIDSKNPDRKRFRARSVDFSSSEKLCMVAYNVCNILAGRKTSAREKNFLEVLYSNWIFTEKKSFKFHILKYLFDWKSVRCCYFICAIIVQVPNIYKGNQNDLLDK